MPIRPRVFLSFCLALLGAACLPAALRAQSAPVILSLSYDSTFPTQYIGTTLTVDMVSVIPNPATPYSANVVTATATQVVLNGLFPASTPIYISDGTRTWETSTTTSGGYLTISAASLLTTANGDPVGDVPLSWALSSYTLLANSTFAVYTGTLVTNATTSTQMSVDIGQFAQVLVYDNATSGDKAAGDGLWTGEYTTPNIGSVVSGAFFYGQCLVGGEPAANEGFQSGQSVNFDMELPSILTYSQSTTNSAYNGDLYLSSLCEGLSAANPADVQPSSAQAQFSFTVNKADTTVLITIAGTPTYPMTSVTLPPFVFPSNTTSLNGWSVWSGTDGNDNFLQDGIYNVYYYIYDTNNLSGVTITSQIKVVSLEMSISNITLTPPIINTEPAITNGVISSIGYTVTLYNDDTNSPLFGAVPATWQAMNRSLNVLGWSDAGVAQYLGGNSSAPVVDGINSQADMYSTLWAMQTQGTLNPQGTFTPFTPGTHSFDWDQYLAQGVFYPWFEAFYGLVNPLGVSCPDAQGVSLIEGDGSFIDDWDLKGFQSLGTINGIAPGTPNGNNYVNPVFTTCTVATSVPSSSWGPYTTPNLAPVSISAQVFFNWVGATPAAGDYRLDLQSQLTGAALYAIFPNQQSGSTAPSPNAPDPCNSTSGNVDYATSLHFFPQTQTDQPSNVVYGTHPQGDLISCQNTAAVFAVNSTANPTSDDTPPQFVVSSPAANSLLQPGVYSLSAPLSAEFQDSTANFNTSGSYSYITLTGPQGNVTGDPSNNLGASNGVLNLEFAPNAPLSIGGNYVMTAYTCNVDGLCSQQNVPFSVLDTTAPSIVSDGVVLSSQTSVQTIPISLCQNTPSGPYEYVDQVAVTVAIPNTSKNTINLAGCSVSLYQVSGTAQIAVGMTQLASQNVTSNQATLVYSINQVLDQNALYEVVTQTESLDPSGGLHIGPAAQPLGTDCTNSPEFSTQFCSSCLNLLYNNNINASCPAVTSAYAITVTTQSDTVVSGKVTTLNPFIGGGTLPAASNYTFVKTAASGSPSTSDPAMEFFVNGVAQNTPLTWTYGGPTLVFSLYYNVADLATGAGTVIAPSNLQILGYNGSWQVVTNATVGLSGTASTGIQCPITVPNGKPAYTYYALAYPSSATATAGSPGTTVVATPVSFPSTRAFDPDSATSPDARFYYSTVAPQSMNVEVYDTAGRRVRSLSLGDGVSATDFTTDPVYNTNVMYYFQWDGKNDAGQVVRNGIYLVRWNEQGVDGSNHAQVKPVALIK